jgi:hypothetical protein
MCAGMESAPHHVVTLEMTDNMLDASYMDISQQRAWLLLLRYGVRMLYVPAA